MAQVQRRRGRIQVKLDALERAALASTVERLEPHTREQQQRAYDEAELQGEYDRWVVPELEQERDADIAVVRQGLEAGEDMLPLTEAQAMAWLRAFNHLRLAAGVILGVEEDGWEERADPATRARPEFGILMALAYLQEELVAALES
jgi:hypothetical protein